MSVLKNSSGLVLFTVLFAVAVVLLFVTGSLLLSRVELKKATNFKLATQAFDVADAGLQHGLASLPWVWDFDAQLNCSSLPCTLVPSTTYSSDSNFTYTVTLRNDPSEVVATDDTNNTVVLRSEAVGPHGTKRTVEAYVRRSAGSFRPPGAVYVSGASSFPVPDSSNPGMGNYYFDIDNGLKVVGNDTTAGNLSNANDDSPGTQSPVWGIATTADSVSNALINEYKSVSSLHDVLGTGAEPSIATVGDTLDIDKIAEKFFNQPGAVKFLNGLITDDTVCPGSSPCQLGTRDAPQITYIKDTYGTDITALRGNVTGYGVLILEGRATIGGNFKFYGLIVHKRSDATNYISLEDRAWIYGGVLIGSYDENDGKGTKARFGFKDNTRVFYSSEALNMVDQRWGSHLPKPARISAWIDK